MAKSDWNVAEACNQLHIVYDCRSSITDIINKMRKNRRTGGHHALRGLNIENV